MKITEQGQQMLECTACNFLRVRHYRHFRFKNSVLEVNRTRAQPLSCSQTLNISPYRGILGNFTPLTNLTVPTGLQNSAQSLKTLMWKNLIGQDSPDLNPKEHVWDEFEWRVSQTFSGQCPCLTFGQNSHIILNTMN